MVSGKYMYIEGSFPRNEGEVARLLSPRLTSPNQKCLKFYYHAYGIDMGDLVVNVIKEDGTKTQAWMKKGEGECLIKA